MCLFFYSLKKNTKNDKHRKPNANPLELGASNTILPFFLKNFTPNFFAVAEPLKDFVLYGKSHIPNKFNFMPSVETEYALPAVSNKYSEVIYSAVGQPHSSSEV